MAKDIAMHIAASNPSYVSIDKVPAEHIAKEKEILAQQMAGTDRTPAILEKMMEGRLRKFFEECVLEEQKFIRSPDLSIKQVLANTAKSLGASLGVSHPELTIASFDVLVLGQNQEEKV